MGMADHSCWRWNGTGLEAATFKVPEPLENGPIDLLLLQTFTLIGQAGKSVPTYFFRLEEGRFMPPPASQYLAATVMLPEGWDPEGAIVEIVLLPDWMAVLSYSSLIGASPANWTKGNDSQVFFSRLEEA